MINSRGRAGHRCVSKARWLGASVFAGFALSTSPAWADCVAGQNGSIVCSGTDTDGLTVSTNQASIQVTQGAATMDRPDGIGAVILQAPSGQLLATLDNRGMIRSNNGAAVTASGNPGFQVFSTILNRSGATIAGKTGGINVVVGRLTNDGIIDGGSGSAYSFANEGGGFVLSPAAIFNTGDMISSGNAATVFLPFGSPQQFGNSGRIVNAGTGLAIDTGSMSLSLVNEATGVIGTAGPIALRSTFQIQVVNAGTINGSLIGGSGFPDYVDTRDGRINGDVLLNEGNDRLIGRLGSDRLVENISGTIDGGAGTDLLELIVGQDRHLSNAILPNGFELLQLNLTNNATLTVSGNTVPAGGYSVRGTGTLRTGSDIAATGAVFIPQVAQQNIGFEALNFINDHTITTVITSPLEAGVSLDSLDKVTNTGTIRATGGNGAWFRLNQGGVAINSGTIEASRVALTVIGSLNNSGMIRSTEDTAFINELGGGFPRQITSTNSGTIEGYKLGVLLSSTNFVNSGTVTATSADGIGINAGYYGGIDNRVGGLISGNLAAIRGGYNAIVINAGTIDGDVDFDTPNGNSSDVFVDRGGIVKGTVKLGDGDDYYVTDLGRGLDGVTDTLDPGTGFDRLRYRADANASATLASVPGFEAIGYELENGASLKLAAGTPFTGNVELTGTGQVELSGKLIAADGHLLDLAPVPIAKLLNPVSPAQGNLHVVNRGTLILDTRSNVNASVAVNAAFLSGDNRIVTFENAGMITVSAVAGPLYTPIAIQGAKEVVNSGTISLSSALGVSGGRLINTGSIVQHGGSSDGVRVWSINNSGTIRVDGIAATLYMRDFSGVGGFSLDNSGTIESGANSAIVGTSFASGNIHNRAGATIRGAGTAIDVSASANIVNEGTISGNIALGTIDDPYASIVENSGSIVGDLRFGGGDDRFVQRAGTVTGEINGGNGNDMFESAGGSTTQPLTLGKISNFERLLISSGYSVMSGSANFDRVDIQAGRLAGLAGSILSAQQVSVSNGATFGSAGTVIGNVSVASGGTLSPGASPGTMTVTGNVALAGGSRTMLEFTPAVSDKLVISGTLNIASGATLAMVGERPLTPGVALDLIVADGGITGGFDTINKAPTVLGFLRQTGNKLQLLGQFVTPSGTSPQIAGAIGYVNDTLVAGQGGAALLGAIPLLLNSDGTTRTAAFSQLTPEAYATASQLGIDQGLSIARTARSGAVGTTRDEAGLYSFVRGIGDWRRLQGNGATGVSRASSHSYGMLGGIGFGSTHASLGAFIGYADSTQRIGVLSTKTSADGVFAGVAGHVEAAGFDLTGLVAYDWSRASTHRAVPGATVRSSNYGLRSLVLDISAGYDLSVGGGWAVRPELGASHVSTRRGGTSESGSSAFALAIDADRTKATFVDGALSLRGGQDDGAAFRPWVQAGVRHQIGGEAAIARGGFVGASTRFDAIGAARKRTMATAGIGFNADIAPGMGLFASYLGEFGGGRSSNADVGVRLAF